MSTTKLNIGKIPISKGEYQEGTAYQRLNQVTMLGSTYQSKIDDNTSAPAQMGADGAVENINTDKWLCIAVGNVSAAKKVVYNNEISGLEAGNVQEAIDEVGSKVSDLSNKQSRIAAIYVGDSKKCIKFTKEDVEGVQHIKLYVKGGDVSILYENGKRISIDEDKTVDYTNTIGRRLFFVAIDVTTKNFSIKEYNAPLGENEFFLFGFNSIFGANLALDWVVYEGFDDNILSNKLSDLSSKQSRIAAIYVGSSKKCIKFTKEDVEGVQHIKLYVKGGDVSILYENGKRISVDEDKTVDYTNTIGRRLFFVAIDVTTKNFSIKEYNAPLGENEFFLFGFNSTFGANLPLDWVVYEGFDDNILSNKLSDLSSSLNDLSFSPISINTKGTIYNGNLITSDHNAFADSIYHEILSNDIFVRYSNNGDYPKLRATFYDKNKGYLSSTTYDRHTKISKPSNAKFVRFSISVEQANMELDAIDKNLVQLRYVEDKGTQLLDVKKELEEKIDNKHAETVLSLNESSLSAIVSMSSRPICKYNMVNIGVLPVFLLMTDLHSDQERFVRGMQFLNYHQQIFAGIMLGDTFESTKNIFDFENIVTSCTKKPVLSVCGNHEVLCRKEVNIKGMSDTDFINTFFPSSLDKQNTVVRQDDKCYWYKDFKSNLASDPKKIRIIGLHQYDFQAQKDSDGYTIDGEQGSGKGKDITYYSQEQIDWLVNLLDNTDKNTYVAIVEHYAMTKEMTLVDTEWNPSSYINQPIEGGSNTGGADNMTNNNFFPEIIQKWIDGGTVEVSNTYKNDNVTVSVNHTFVAHRKQFIGYFSGHTHRDGVYKLTEYPSQHQFMLNLASVSDGLNSSDIGRSISGKSQDCFTLVSYDWYNHRVNLLRIGADVTTDMRDRKMCSISLG